MSKIHLSQVLKPKNATYGTIAGLPDSLSRFGICSEPCKGCALWRGAPCYPACIKVSDWIAKDSLSKQD